MTQIGLAHYGGTLGLYNQPNDEIARALAYYEHMDERALAKQRADQRGKKRAR